jgi:hypothetical protein
VETIGLLDDERVAELSVSWPTSRTTQTFRALAADQSIEIREGANEFRSLSRAKAPTARLGPDVPPHTLAQRRPIQYIRAANHTARAGRAPRIQRTH